MPGRRFELLSVRTESDAAAGPAALDPDAHLGVAVEREDERHTLRVGLRTDLGEPRSDDPRLLAVGGQAVARVGLRPVRARLRSSPRPAAAAASSSFVASMSSFPPPPEIRSAAGPETSSLSPPSPPAMTFGAPAWAAGDDAVGPRPAVGGRVAGEQGELDRRPRRRAPSSARRAGRRRGSCRCPRRRRSPAAPGSARGRRRRCCCSASMRTAGVVTPSEIVSLPPLPATTICVMPSTGHSTSFSRPCVQPGPATYVSPAWKPIAR